MNIVGKRKWYFLISALVLIPGIISLIIPPAMQPGIDFSSGSAFEVTFTEAVEEEPVRAAMTEADHADARIQKLSTDTMFIRTKELQEGERDQIQAVLAREVAPVDFISKVETVSPEVAAEPVRNAVIAVMVAAVGILLYITWAFRHIPGSFRYGVAAVLALIHDVLIIIGIFSILGKVIGLEVNVMFVVGLLAVAGYSVNDTIVVFDRNLGERGAGHRPTAWGVGEHQHHGEHGAVVGHELDDDVRAAGADSDRRRDAAGVPDGAADRHDSGDLQFDIHSEPVPGDVGVGRDWAILPVRQPHPAVAAPRGLRVKEFPHPSQSPSS